MNRAVIKKTISKVFELNCVNLDIEADGTVKKLIGDVLYLAVNPTQMSILHKIHNLIQQKVRGAIHDQNDVQDAISYVSTEVLKSYKFRYKYKNGLDWENVVKSVINRRLIDFSGKQYRYKRLVHNSGLFDSDSDYLDYYYNKEFDKSAERLYRHDQAKFVIDTYKNNRNKFLPIELEYIDAILYLYDNGFDPMEEYLVYGVMGYEKGNQDHKREFNRIRNKTQRKLKDMVRGVSYADSTTFG